MCYDMYYDICYNICHDICYDICHDSRTVFHNWWCLVFTLFHSVVSLDAKMQGQLKCYAFILLPCAKEARN